MQPPDAPAQARPNASAHLLRAGTVVGLAYSLIGWRGLLVPSMIRSVEPSFRQDDAGMGLYFLATAIAYGVGVLLGGRFVRARGQRTAVAAALAAMSLGLVLQGLTASWPAFAALGVLVSLGASTADIGINSLVLDLFPASRGRALNLLHVMYSVGALTAPLALAAAVGGGIAWQVPMLVSGVVAGAAALGVVLTVPPGQLDPPDPDEHPDNAADVARGRRIPVFLLVMAVGTACYVASEAGVSDWLVRYLDVLPVTAASFALTLFWAGIAVGRIVFAKIGGRVDALSAASVLAPIGGAFLLAAFLLPVGPWTPLLFAAVGFAFGPFFPLMVAAGGARLPSRSATVASTLIFSAVLGATFYPPAIGFISVSVGLQAAMVGTAVLAFAAGAAGLASRRLGA
jgi:fucose permease